MQWRDKIRRGVFGGLDMSRSNGISALRPSCAEMLTGGFGCEIRMGERSYMIVP